MKKKKETEKDTIITGQQISPALRIRAMELRQNITPAESKLWQHLRANRLGGFHFRRQQIIGYTIVDFYCHSVGLVIEVDGDVHLQQKSYDRERDQILASLGLQVLRFANQDIELRIENVLDIIQNNCASRSKST